MELLDDNLVLRWTADPTPDLEATLVTELRRYALNLCYSSLGYERAKELANDCVLYVLMHPNAWSGLSKFRTWYHAIVMNKVRDAYKARDTETDQANEDIAIVWADPEVRLLEADIRKHLGPDDVKLLDSVLCGYSAQEIAQETGRLVDTVYKQLARMRSNVREILSERKTLQ